MKEPRSILVTRLDGLGDLVLGTRLLHGLHMRWPQARLRLVVRRPHDRVGEILPDWVQVVTLGFDPRAPVGTRKDAIVAELRRVADTDPAELVVIAEYNRVWAGELLAQCSGAQRVVAFDGPRGLNINHRAFADALGVSIEPEHWELINVDESERELVKYAAMLSALGVTEAPPPAIDIRAADRERAQQVYESLELEPARTIVCFPSSGDGATRSPDPPVWSAWLQHLALRHQSRLLMLGSAGDEACLQDIERAGLPEGTQQWLVPGGDVSLLAAFLADARGYVGADTGPMHIAAVLGRPTLGVFGGGTWPRFVPYGLRAVAVCMPLGCFGCGWHCPFERRRCIKELPLTDLLRATDVLLADRPPGPPEDARRIEAPAPATADFGLMRAAMHSHGRWLAVNHELIGLHNWLVELAETRRQHERAIRHINQTLTDMTTANEQRDQAIDQLGRVISEMSGANTSRDEAINHVSGVLEKMSVSNSRRDEAIARQNAARETTAAELRRQLDEAQRAWDDRLTEMRETTLPLPRFLGLALRRLLRGRRRSN